MADLDLDAKRVSLLDVIHKSKSEIVTTRLTWVASLTEVLTPAKAAKLAERYQELLQAANGTAQGASDEPTGLLLLFPCCAAAQLEARPDATNEALRALQACASELSLGTIRVISLTDDLPARAHHSSASAFGGGEARAHADPAEEGAAVSVASDINLKFIAFGQQLQALKGQELTIALENVGTYWEGMPKAEAILSLTMYEAAPSAIDFLGLFSGPVDIDFESERVWPIPRMPEVK